MSIGGSILNLELSRPHDTFMAQLRDAWRMIRGADFEEDKIEEDSLIEAIEPKPDQIAH